MNNQSKNGYKLTWKRARYDDRDFKYFPKLKAEELPASFEIPGPIPPIYDQGNEGSCTAWQPKRFVVRMDMMDNNFQDYSAQFIYYNERVIEGTVNSDSGAYIRDSVKALVNWGVCPEGEWPYSTNNISKNLPRVHIPMRCIIKH